MVQTLLTLLGNNLGSMNGGSAAGDAFAEKVIEAAKKHKIDLHSIPELKYADLNGDGKITGKEIATLIEIAHDKRTGGEFITVSSNSGRHDGGAFENPEYDSQILPADLNAMTDLNIIKKAKFVFNALEGVGIEKQIDKETLIALKGIKGGKEVNEKTLDSANNSIGKTKKSYTLG